MKARYLFRILGLVILALATGACNGSTGSTGPKEPPLEGTYQLRKIANQDLPWLSSQTADFKLEVVSGDLILKSDGTYTSSTKWVRSFTGGASPKEELGYEEGTWKKVEETLILFNQGPLERRGTISLGSITRHLAALSGGTWIYKK